MKTNQKIMAGACATAAVAAVAIYTILLIQQRSFERFVRLAAGESPYERKHRRK